MAGLDPAIHVFVLVLSEDVDARHEAGHDENLRLRLDPEFIHELFAQFGPVTMRRMFSGAGIFRDGLMFGLVIRDVIYLKADETNAAEFEREGSAPFTYTRGRKSGRPSQHALPYWRLPERLYDDPEELAVWARHAFAVAERKKFAGRQPAKRNARRVGKGARRRAHK
jgi:DNA transformation protein and related proteins